MTENTISEEALLKQEQDKIRADLKREATVLGQAALRTLIRTGTVHLIGRKVAPQIFSSFGRSYAVLLLVDMLKTKRLHITPPAEEGVVEKDTKTHLKTVTFKPEDPTTTEGYTEGDQWCVADMKSAIIKECYTFDGKHWVPDPLFTKSNVD